MVGEEGKRAWLLGRLQAFIDEGDVLVFANQKTKVDELAAAMQVGRTGAGWCAFCGRGCWCDVW